MSKISRPSTVLAKAKETLSNGWCKGALAMPNRKSQPQPDRFCAIGSIYDALGAEWDVRVSTDEGVLIDPLTFTYDGELLDEAMKYLARGIAQLGMGRKSKKQALAAEVDYTQFDVWDDTIIGFNDDYTTRKAWVVEAFDIAIELARKAEQRQRQQVSRARRRQLVSA